MAGQRDLLRDRSLELVLYFVIHKRRRHAPESVPTSNTFGGFMTFSKTRYLDSLPLLNVAYTNITSPTLFFINLRVCAYVIAFLFRVFVLFSLRFNLNFTRLFASLTLQI